MLIKEEAFHGQFRRRRYFEGWYFKLVNMDASESWSLIPGISYGARRGEGCSFIQVIEGSSARTWWFEFPLAAFSASARRLLVRIGPNEFSEKGIRLNLANEEAEFQAELGFGPFSRLSGGFLSPGIMGPYAFAPFMECRHGLVSLDHEVSGLLSFGGRRVDFSGGRGYAEKDWGSSMPRSWIWTQSNNFPRAGDSFMLSLAEVPWLGAVFPGFLCVGRLGGEDILEASYTGARVAGLRVEDDYVSLNVMRGDMRLELRCERARGGLLRAPVSGLLSRRIAESVDAILRIRLLRSGRLAFEGSAAKAGLEIVGEVSRLG